MDRGLTCASVFTLGGVHATTKSVPFAAPARCATPLEACREHTPVERGEELREPPVDLRWHLLVTVQVLLTPERAYPRERGEGRACPEAHVGVDPRGRQHGLQLHSRSIPHNAPCCSVWP